jgi:hypothetical protein
MQCLTTDAFRIPRIVRDFPGEAIPESPGPLAIPPRVFPDLMAYMSSLLGRITRETGLPGLSKQLDATPVPLLGWHLWPDVGITGIQDLADNMSHATTLLKLAPKAVEVVAYFRTMWIARQRHDDDRHRPE